MYYQDDFEYNNFNESPDFFEGEQLYLDLHNYISEHYLMLPFDTKFILN